MESIPNQLNSILYNGDINNYMPSLSEQFFSYTESQCKVLVKHLKDIIKQKKSPPMVKLQALRILKACMDSKNPYFIAYSAKKLYNRFRIFGEYKKEIPDKRRGATLFNASLKQDQKASEEFLILLLRCIKDWNNDYGVDSKGKTTNFYKLYHYLISKGVVFPTDPKIKEDQADLRKKLRNIKKNVKTMLRLISNDLDPDEIRKIGKSLKLSNEMIQDKIEKFMEMEDHELIKSLNESLDYLNDAQSAYDSWKSSYGHQSKTIHTLLPPTCLFLKDLSPKSPPVPDDLSESQELLENDSILSLSVQTDKEIENEKDTTSSFEWTGLGADYCRLKDKIDLAEQNATNLKYELDSLNAKYLEEQQLKECIQLKLDYLQANEAKTQKKTEKKIYYLEQANNELREQNKRLTENIKELEINLDKITQESVAKQEKIEALELNNLNLVSSCKSLEKDVEAYIQSEKYLKKEIKKLFKKIHKKKPEKDSSFGDTNSEIVARNDESLTKEDKNLLLPELKKFNSEPTNYEEPAAKPSESVSLEADLDLFRL